MPISGATGYDHRHVSGFRLSAQSTKNLYAA
jgi:hypothetical protein